MDNLLFVNLLRGMVTSILNIILIFSLVEFKYSKKFTISVLALICTLIMMVSLYFYIFYDLTVLARYNIVLWLITGLACKFLSTDGFMKGLFNVVTAINILFFVVVFSYVLSRPLPYPMYAHTVIRIFLYVIFIILFKKFVYPLYRQVVDRWHLFLSVAVGFMLNFAYILSTSQDIAETFSQNVIPILLLVGLMFIV